MASFEPSRKDLLSACSDIGAGDGQDPRYDRHEPAGRPQGRKSKQLCRQAQHTLQQVLLGCGDDVLRDLEVLSAIPAGGGRLLVTLAPAASAARRDGATVGHLQLVETGRPGEIEVLNMAVVPAHRGTGVGRALLDEAVARCTAEGWTRMVVATAAADTQVSGSSTAAGSRPALLRSRDASRPNDSATST